MKKFVLVIVAIVALVSCKEDGQVLSKNKMASVLRDVHLCDGVFNTQRYAVGRLENLDSLYLYDGVFKKNKITREEFIYSLQYYSKYPRKLDEIYTMVVNDLSAQQEKMREELRSAEPKRKLKAKKE